MRRIALTFLSLAAIGAALVATSAGADDMRTYQAELYNGFGLVNGSELRVAGVAAGTVTDLDITEDKTALITFTVGPEFPEFYADASCSSEPQSLIAEYYLDCHPGTSDEPLDGPIPAEHNKTTVQNDLVQNTLREPFNRRFQLIINEFGTALVGNPENLNQAIRAGAPALSELHQALKILGRQNDIITQLNVDSDTIFAELAAKREGVVNFIDKAEDAARVSASVRDDLSQNFNLLDDALAEIQPTMVEIGNLAREQTPLFADLYAAAPGLNRLARNLPAFNDGTRVSLEALADTSDVGKRALTKSRDEVKELSRSSKKAYPAANLLANFVRSLDNPNKAVGEDARARTDLQELPGEANRRVAGLNDVIPGGGINEPGYTGLEGLLNYVYYQTGALNQFDSVGHLLHFTLIDIGGPFASPCEPFSEQPNYPKIGGGTTTDLTQAAPCVSVTGNNQPDITVPLNLPRYDNSVCPQGSDDLSICDPAVSTHGRAAPVTTTKKSPEDMLKDALQVQKDPSKKKIREALGLGADDPIPGAKPSTDAVGDGAATNATNDLLDFLFGA